MQKISAKYEENLHDWDEARLHAFLQAGKPAKDALHASGTHSLPAGVDIYHELFRLRSELW